MDTVVQEQIFRTPPHRFCFREIQVRYLGLCQFGFRSKLTVQLGDAITVYPEWYAFVRFILTLLMIYGFTSYNSTI